MIAIDGIPPSMYGGAGGGDRALQGRAAAFGGASAATAPVAGGSGYSNAVPSASSMAGPSSSGKSIAGWGQMFKNSREYTVLKKVVRILQDNRLNSGDEETAQRLQDLNRSQTESYPILKTILNVIFITTGVVLLIAVVVVIIYTSLVKPGDGHSSLAAHFGFHEETRHASVSSSSETRDHPHAGNFPDGNSHRQLAETDGDSAQRNLPSGKPHPVRLRNAVKRCRIVPIFEGNHKTIKFVQLCLEMTTENFTMDFD